jgi:hypothetical protein
LKQNVRILVAAGLSPARVFDLAAEHQVVMVLDNRRNGADENDTLAWLLDKYCQRVDDRFLGSLLAKMMELWSRRQAVFLVLATEGEAERVEGEIRQACGACSVEICDA